MGAHNLRRLDKRIGSDGEHAARRQGGEKRGIEPRLTVVIRQRVFRPCRIEVYYNDPNYRIRVRDGRGHGLSDLGLVHMDSCLC